MYTSRPSRNDSRNSAPVNGRFLPATSASGLSGITFSILKSVCHQQKRLSPELLGREPGTLGQRDELCPCQLRVDASAETAIRASNDVFAAHDLCKADNSIGDKFGMLDQVGRVADDTGHQELAVRQLDILPHFPFVLVAH